MIIAFFGHRSLDQNQALFEKLQKTLFAYMSQGEFLTFYCGGYGDFDRLCARVCRSFRSRYQNFEIVLVTPYMSESQLQQRRAEVECGLYDAVLYPSLEEVPPRFAICKRNEWMIDQADLVIGYVKHHYGGAYNALEYARRKKKPTINLVE